MMKNFLFTLFTLCILQACEGCKPTEGELPEKELSEEEKLKAQYLEWCRNNNYVDTTFSFVELYADGHQEFVFLPKEELDTFHISTEQKEYYFKYFEWDSHVGETICIQTSSIDSTDSKPEDSFCASHCPLIGAIDTLTLNYGEESLWKTQKIGFSKKEIQELVEAVRELPGDSCGFYVEVPHLEIKELQSDGAFFIDRCGQQFPCSDEKRMCFSIMSNSYGSLVEYPKTLPGEGLRINQNVSSKLSELTWTLSLQNAYGYDTTLTLKTKFLKAH